MTCKHNWRLIFKSGDDECESQFYCTKCLAEAIVTETNYGRTRTVYIIPISEQDGKK